METTSKTLKSIMLTDLQTTNIETMACKTCTNAMWQETDRGITAFCRITFRDTFSERTDARIHKCDAQSTT